MKKSYDNWDNSSLKKQLLSGLHVNPKTRDSQRSDPRIKSFLWGFSHNCSIFDYNKNYYYARMASKFLKKTISTNKQILFVGSPQGFDKEFKQFCKENEFYFIKNWVSGFITNSKSDFIQNNAHLPKIKKPLSLVFVFNVSDNLVAINEVLEQKTVPLMTFLDHKALVPEVDFILPYNVNSAKGGLFAFNLLHMLLNKNRTIENPKTLGSKK